MKKINFQEYCIENEQTHLLNEWNYDKNEGLLPDSLSKSSRVKVWWKCPDCGYEWKTQLASRAIELTGCPNCYKLKQKARRAQKLKGE